ncbi:unnamed protein product [Meganyctiphanes norvegica]|uniref:Uncharacterized protein n=1 Tax=Meganyctiphanes norvegica TaxID=48144 RepID=A0AAV2QZP2_MEGNR
MFDNCSYHLSESLIPSADEEDNFFQDSLLRLESICACSIVRSEKNCQILSETPAPLHKIIWEIYLRDEYNTRTQHGKQILYENKENENMLEGLPELLYHWPYEEFILKELMPKFEPRLGEFSFLSDTGHFKLQQPFYWNHDNKDNWQIFHKIVVNTIVRTFLINFKDKMSLRNRYVGKDNSSLKQTHMNTHKIKLINVCGFYTFYLYSDLLDYIEIMGIDEPILKNNNGKLEVILDIDIQNARHACWADISIGGIASAVHRFAYSQLNSSNPVVLKFNHVALDSYMDHNTATVDVTKMEQLIKMFVKDYGTVSLKLIDDNGIGSTLVMKNAFKNNENQSKILSVTMIEGYPSIHSMQYLTNLVHLDLSWVDMHGKLSSLKHMQRGLLFLNLDDCRLNSEDLAQLTESCHQETLKELNLNYNNFTYDTNCNNLIRLCQKLTKVQVLKLQDCRLESWPINEIKLLVYPLKHMPHIIKLDLSGNRFVMDIVRMIILELHENLSLRLLKLSLHILYTHKEDYNSDEVKSFCSSISGKINNGRSQVLYIKFK